MKTNKDTSSKGAETSKASHTPTPWNAVFISSTKKYAIFDADGDYMSIAEDLSEANAELIVRAVNSLESNEAEIRRLKKSNKALLEAMKQLINEVQDNFKGIVHLKKYPAYQQAKLLITQIEGRK